MVLDYVDAWEALQQGRSVITTCDHCGERIWAHKAEWTGIKPYHPECEDELVQEVFDEMIEEIEEEPPGETSTQSPPER